MIIRCLKLIALLATTLSLGGIVAASASAQEPDVIDRDGACRAIGGPNNSLSADGELRVSKEPEDSSVEVTGELLVQPPVIDVQRPLQAGDSLTCTITIRNRTSQEATFTLEPMGVIGGESTRFIGLEEFDSDLTAASWIEPAQGKVTLGSLQSATVPVMVTVPDTPPVGSAYAAIHVIPETEEQTPLEGETAIGLEQRLSIAFLLRIGGAGKPRLSLTQIEDEQRSDYWYWRAKLANGGTLHTEPRGTLTVKSLFGRTKLKQSLDSRPLLPGGSIVLDARWNDLPWLGIYKAHASVRYNDETGETSDHRLVWDGWIIVLPAWWQLLLLVLLVVAIPVAIWLRRRADWKQYLDEAREELEAKK